MTDTPLPCSHLTCSPLAHHALSTKPLPDQTANTGWRASSKTSRCFVTWDVSQTSPVLALLARHPRRPNSGSRSSTASSSRSPSGTCHHSRGRCAPWPEGIDSGQESTSTETAAPTIHAPTLKIFIAWIVQEGLLPYQFDQSNAFYGNPMDVAGIVLMLPPGFDPHSDKLRPLHLPPLYGEMVKGVPGTPY